MNELNSWKHRWFGFWSEEENPVRDAVSLKKAQGSNWDQRELEKVAHYLRNAPVVVASPGVCRSLFDSNQISGTSSLRTDGEWIWPDTLAFYIEKHHVALPSAFLNRIRQSDYQIADVNLTEVVTKLEFPAN